MIDSLNQQYAIDDHVSFSSGVGNLPRALISNSLAEAEIYLNGAHVTAFQPHTAKQPVLWMSDRSLFRPGKAIRGGIPVVWPWFGPHPTDGSKPQHGFARNEEWSVSGTDALEDGSTQISFQLTDNNTTRSLWPYAFELELIVTVGAQLQVELISRNRSDKPFEIGSALHTYFAVGNIDEVAVAGLAGCFYLDQLDQHQQKRQNGLISVAEEVDRIYLDTTEECVLIDHALQRTIKVAKQGSQTTVVWNPWIDKASRMNDFPDEGYRTMLCIEACNTQGDMRLLAPDVEHRLVQIIAPEYFG